MAQLLRQGTTVSTAFIVVASLLFVWSAFEKTVARRLAIILAGLFSLGIGLVNLLVKSGMEPMKGLVPLAIFGLVSLAFLSRLNLSKRGDDAKDKIKYARVKSVGYLLLAAYFIVLDVFMKRGYTWAGCILLVLGVWELVGLWRLHKQEQSTEDHFPKSVS